MIKTFTQVFGTTEQGLTRYDYNFEILDHPIGGKDVLLFDNDKAFRYAWDLIRMFHNWGIHMAAKHFNGTLYFTSICDDTKLRLDEYRHQNRGKLPEGVRYDPETGFTYFPSVQMLRSYVPVGPLADYPLPLPEETPNE